MEDAITSRAPGRREERRASRRDAIIDVAARSFLEQGYANTTMNGIAATLGGSKGTLWSYFPSKENLFAAVLDRITEAFQRELTVILNPAEPLENALRKVCMGLIERTTSPQGVALYRLIVGEVQRFPEIGPIFYERGPNATRAQLATYLAEAMAKGKLRAGDPEIAAQHLAGLCLSGLHMQMLCRHIEQATPRAKAEEAERAIAAFLRAYAPEATGKGQTE